MNIPSLIQVQLDIAAIIETPISEEIAKPIDYIPFEKGDFILVSDKVALLADSKNKILI